MSHAAANLDTTPLITGSIVFAVLVFVGLLTVIFARAWNLIETKDVGMVMIFVLTAGFSMWIVWLSCWMVSNKCHQKSISCSRCSWTFSLSFKSKNDPLTPPPIISSNTTPDFLFQNFIASMASSDVSSTTKRRVKNERYKSKL